MKPIRLFLLALASCFAFLNIGTALAEDKPQYFFINPPQPTSADDGQIEVIEIFSYACSHCHRFEPLLQSWAKKQSDKVKVVQMPAIFNDLLALYARAFYTAEALGVMEKVHQPFFDAIHVQKRRLSSEEEIAGLFVENGVDRKDFDKAFRSFAVEAKVRRAAELGNRYGVQATPSMVINGKYITNPSQSGGFKGMLNLVDQLIVKEQAGV